MVKYSIIIPTRNEEEGIAKVICSIPQSIVKDAEIIVVDSSDDLTPTIARRLGAKVIRVPKKGKGYAMRVAARKAKGEILIFLDGDGTDPPTYIPKLLKKLNKYDIVLGTRSLAYSDKDAKAYRLIFKIYGAFVIPAFKAAGLKIKGDPLAGFRVMRKETWEKLDLKSNDFLIETEMNFKALKLGMKIGEVPIPHLPRAGGLLKSKLVRDPKQWIKILKMILSFVKEEKFKKKIKKGISRIKKDFNP